MKIVLDFHPLIAGICFVPVLFAFIQTPTKDYSSFTRYPLCRASDNIRYPTNCSAVVAIVNEAIKRGVTVKAFGERHSKTDIICTDGIPIDMRELKSYTMNCDDTATFGAGVTLQEAGDYLVQYERAFKVMPAYGHITLGGAVGTGAHGSSIKFHSSLSAQVVKMTIVNGLGKLEVISNRDDLKSFRTHLGLLGIVVDVTLNTVPLYKVKAHNYIVSDEILTNGVAINWASSSDQIMISWFPTFNEVVVLNYTFVPAKTPGNARSQLIPISSSETSVLSTLYKESAFNLSTSACTKASALGQQMLHVLEMVSVPTFLRKIPGEQPFYTDNGTNFLNPAIGYPHEMLASICSTDIRSSVVCSWIHPGVYGLQSLDNEIGFALTDLPAVIATIKDIVKKTPTAFPLKGLIFRFSGKSDIYMSTSYERDTVHMEFLHWKRSDVYNDASGNLAGYQTILQALVKKFKARSHWAKSGLVYHSRGMLDLKLDIFARLKFMAAMKKFDPNGIFLNNFGRRLTYNGTKIDIDPLTTKCALLDNCFCSKDSDCADTQTCTTISGYRYPVCKTKNIRSGQTFNRKEYPANFSIVDWFKNTVPALISSLKC